LKGEMEMAKIVIIGAGSGFGSRLSIDILAREALQDATIALCDTNYNDQTIDHAAFLQDMMTRHKFGEAYVPDQYSAGSITALAEPLGGTGTWIPSFALRWDKRLGLALGFRGYEIIATYLVPRITWIPNVDFNNHDQFSFEALITNSASRFVEGYISFGAAYDSQFVTDSAGNQVRSGDMKWQPVAEFGTKFRVRVTGKTKILTVGHGFAGFRFGVRFNGIDTINNGRIIFEVGAGVF